jgi:hypothetical protein
MKRILTVFLYIFCLQAYSQGYQFGIGIGKSVYWGDLNAPAMSVNLNKNGGLAIQVFGEKNIKEQVGLRANVLFGNLQGNDANSSIDSQISRNLSFKSKLFEFSFLAKYYIFGYSPYSQEKVFSPFVSVGLAGFYYNPTTVYNGTTYELQPLGTEGQGNVNYGPKYRKFAGALPFGAGAALRIGQTMDIQFDVIARRTTTDFIDDLSGSYVNYNELKSLNGDLAAILSDRTIEVDPAFEVGSRPTGAQRGGSRYKDWYITAMITLGFTISDASTFNRRKSRYKRDCPKFN